jgi:hypothetical protein
MTHEVGPTKDERAQAIYALLPVLSGLIEATAETATSHQVTASAGRLAQSLREAAVVAEALGRCCQTNGNSSPGRRNDPKPDRALGQD